MSYIYGFGKNWSAAFFFGTLIFGVALSMGEILGDETARGVIYGVELGAAAFLVGIHILRLFGSFFSMSWMGLYQSSAYSPALRTKLRRSWVVIYLIVATGIAWIAYAVIWTVGPAAFKQLTLEEVTWIFVAADIYFIMFNGLIAAWFWPALVVEKGKREHMEGKTPINKQNSQQIANLLNAFE
jgi:bacteriorhodopsin